MIEREITTPTLLLDRQGNLLKPAYAKQMLYEYNRPQVAGRPFGLKEWDFYQVALGDWVLQMTIGHVSYAANFAAKLFSLTTGEQHSFYRLRPFPMRRMPMPLHPNETHVLPAKGKDFDMVYECHADYRTLRMTVSGDEPVDIDLKLPHVFGDEAMVIAIPFENKKQFYLNNKQQFFGVTGHVRFGDRTVEATGTETAILDWGRGVWPFSHEWFWGNGAALMDGGRFGFNIGWGFGDLSATGENMFFWNGKAYKVGQLEVDRDPNNYTAPWHFRSNDGLLDLTMTPIFDHQTATKVLFVNNSCHQVFGHFNGTAQLPDGQIIKVKDMVAFCEHAVNHW